MSYSSLIDEELILMNGTFSSQKNFFKKISEDLRNKHLVEETFTDAIMDREQEYPTGLNTGDLTIAIPHTDIIHVKKPFIYVAKLAESLSFIQMGTTDERVDVDYIFVLGIKDPSNQVGLLSLIMDKFQDEHFKESFKRISSRGEMSTFLKVNFRSDNT